MLTNQVSRRHSENSLRDTLYAQRMHHLLAREPEVVHDKLSSGKTGPSSALLFRPSAELSSFSAVAV